MASQLGFFFDASACVGCKACQLACKDINDLKVGTLYRRVYEMEGGTWRSTGDGYAPQGVFAYHVALSCNHCANPVCVAVCPTGAMQKDPENGVVWTDHDMCIGCRSCENACPYHAPRFLEDKGYMGKCDFCRDELNAGRKPACTTVCAVRALDYGDIDELRATHGEGNCLIEPLPDAGTDPQIVLIPHPQAPESGSGLARETSFNFEV